MISTDLEPWESEMQKLEEKLEKYKRDVSQRVLENLTKFTMYLITKNKISNPSFLWKKLEAHQRRMYQINFR